MADEIVTQFKTEGTKPFEDTNTENENSATSSTDQTNTDQTQSQEGEGNSSAKTEDGGADTTNFAEHPRWKERESDWDKRFNEQEQRHVGELAKLREEFLGSKSANADSATSEVPAWFGGDEGQWKQYQSHTQELVQSAVKMALGQVEAKSQEEQTKITKATEYMNQEIATLEADKNLNPNGQQIDRNKLLKFVLDEKLVDTEGRWNYKAAFKLMKADDVFKAKGALNEKRAVASATTSENRAESKPKAFMTNQDYAKPENRPW